jgi:hypothetical protein
VFDRAAVLMAFEQVGGADARWRWPATMRWSVTPSAGRSAQPAGDQAHAGRHVCVGHAGPLERYYGAWASTESAELPEAAATARVSATQAFQHCARNNIQVHGGMGFTWAFDCHLYYRRSNLLAVSLGAITWEDRLIDHLRARRAPERRLSARAPRNHTMNFDDTPQEAAFRAEARAWIQANAPQELRAELELAGFGQPALRSGDVLKAGKAWQKKKQRRRLGLPALADRIRRPRRHADRTRDLAAGGRRLRQVVRHPSGSARACAARR